MRAAYPDVDRLVAYQRLEEDADESDEPVLHVAVLDRLARRDAIGYVQVDELRREVHLLRTEDRR